MHNSKTETYDYYDPPLNRVVSSHGATSEPFGIELAPLAAPAANAQSPAIGAKSPNADEQPSASVADTESSPGPARKVSRLQSVTVVTTLAGISFLNTMGSGILIAALPRISRDLGLSQALILWPAAVYALAAGCLLLIFGAATDAIGTKLVWITGGFLYTVFTLAIGFAQIGIQIILFRAFQGVAIAMCLPTAVSLITNTFPKGKWRNTAFAMNGMGQPLGYALGMVLGGIFTDTIGWRWAYYMMTIISFCLSTAAIWSLPSIPRHSLKKWSRQLVEDIDWLGAVIMSAGLGLLFYVLATTASSYTSIRSAPSIAILVVSLLLLGSFPFWMHYQTARGKPALIPNRLWSQASFTSVCIAVFFCWASLNGIEYFTTLYFQQVEGISALQSSIRFLPHVVMGIAANIVTAYLVARVKIQYLAVVSALITMIAPPLMATVEIDENYWFAPFWALFLSPVNPDVLFTVSNLVISDAFPPEMQSLAGGVFNEVCQFGNSVGLAVTAAIAASITDREAGGLERAGGHVGNEDALTEGNAAALMKGYRAAFWTIFTGTAVVVVVSAFGLRKAGFVGKKND